MTKKDLILYTIRGLNLSSCDIDRTLMGRLLKLKRKTIDKYLRSLEVMKFLIIKKNESGRIIGYELTKHGQETVDKIDGKMMGTFFNPSTSGFARKVSLKIVLDHLRDPYEEMEFLSRYLFENVEDVTEIIEDIKINRPDSRFSRFMQEVLNIEGSRETNHLEQILQTSSLYSFKSEEIDNSYTFPPEEVVDLILDAEKKRRRGDIKEARSIYNGLLRRRKGIEKGNWLLCMNGLVQCFTYDNKEKEAIEQLDRILKDISDPREIGFFRKIKADILQDLGRYEDASRIYRKCLGVFNKSEFPLIRVTILNNLGVQYCRRKKMKIATDFWEEAIKIARKIELPYVESIISMNLADAYATDKRFKKADRLLRASESELKDIGDLEGLSGVYFNKALVYIEKGNRKKAVKFYEMAMAFPLTYKQKRDERKDVFEGRMRDKGFLLSNFP